MFQVRGGFLGETLANISTRTPYNEKNEPSQASAKLCATIAVGIATHKYPHTKFPDDLQFLDFFEGSLLPSSRPLCLQHPKHLRRTSFVSVECCHRCRYISVEPKPIGSPLPSLHAHHRCRLSFQRDTRRILEIQVSVHVVSYFSVFDSANGINLFFFLPGHQFIQGTGTILRFVSLKLV